MKVSYLNIFEGCKEEERFKKLIDFVRKEDPDVLGLSELYDWDKNDRAKLKIFLGQSPFRSYAFCESNNGFHVGIFSKFELSHSADISRGVGMAKVKAIIPVGNLFLSVVVAHLSADNEDTRLKELAIILEQVQNGEPAIIMGDFNSLSPLDEYDDDRVMREMRDAGMTKFGTDKLRKEVVQKVMDAGFVDSVREHTQTFEHSVPTAYCSDKNHFTKLRLDYLFITNVLRDRLKSAAVLRTEETNWLSDHFPLSAEFALG